MPVYLSRKEYVSTVYYYEKLVDDVMVQEYTEYINDNYEMEHDGPITLTQEDIVKAWEGWWDGGILDTRMLRDKNYPDHEYHPNYTLGDVLKDLMSNDMWDQDYDQGDTHTEEVIDDVIRTEIKIS